MAAEESPGSGWIICGGMIRSGSTLQFQIASELIERSRTGARHIYCDEFAHARVLAEEPPAGRGTFKTHSLSAPVRDAVVHRGARVLYSFRDLRDVITSQREKNGGTLSIAEVRDMAAGLVDSDTRWRALPGVHVVRYEDMVADLAKEVDLTARCLRVSLPAEELDEIARTLSYDAQRLRIESVPEEAWVEVDRDNVYDRHSLLHRNHLQTGRVGRYSQQLDPGLVAAIEDVAAGWLYDNGYARVM